MENLSGYIPEDVAPKETELKKACPFDATVVFGAGVRTDQDLQDRGIGARIVGKEEQGWRLSIAAKMRVRAAAELFFDDQTKEVFLTGGAVGKEKGFNLTEAELMRDYFMYLIKTKKAHELVGDPDIEKKVSEYLEQAVARVRLENQATNTIENFAHTINFFDESGQYDTVAFVSNDFHIARILQLAEKFQLSGEGVGSEEYLKHKEQDRRIQTIIDRYFDPEVNKRYLVEVMGSTPEERKPQVAKRLGGPIAGAYDSEVRWSRGLKEIPEYWLPHATYINDAARLKKIISADPEATRLLNERGISDVEEASADEIRDSLSKIDRVMPPKEWAERKTEE